MKDEFYISKEKMEKRKKIWHDALERQKARDEWLATLYKNGASVSSIAWYFNMNESTVLSRLHIMKLITDEEAGLPGYSFYKKLYYGG